ncbi:phospholipase A2 inhibitor gamma subunit B-like [Natator depressus]|uniref:phospholipase A2 inhibitor gamma subunit B-like n=1 Tax=Natator depressus TaxID=27790 RepID=UPI003EB6B3E8
MKVSFSFCILLAFIDAVSKRIVITQKSCLHSNSCRTDPISMNFGNGMTHRSRITCCVGEDCKTASDPLPPMNTIPNGLQCPACYAENSYQCSENTVSCTGVQTQCFDIAGKITIGALPLKAAMKGCTTESECAAPKGEKGLDVDIVRFECKPASSRGHKALGFAPRVALLLPALSGLILVLPLS